MQGTIVGIKPPSGLALRDAPRLTGKVLARIPVGTILNIIKKGILWHTVLYMGISGYVSALQVKIMPKVAVLDPGHFKNHNRGAAMGYWEGNWSLPYAKLLAAELTQLGWKVVLTRYTGADLSLVARGKIAIRYKADLFYSIHSNASSDSGTRRVTAFYSVDRPKDEALTLAMAKTVAGIMGSPSFHAETRASTVYHSPPDPSRLEDYYTVIDTASDGGVPHVVLVEHDYHTNPDVCKWLSAAGSKEGAWSINLANCQAMAKAEAACINNQLK